jgi:hypothetical protein
MKRILLLFAFWGIVSFANAQTEENGFDWGASAVEDTTVVDSSGEEGDQKQEAPIVKPYERIELIIDSITNLITYSGVVEQEESGSDSLYIRAKKWAAKQFGKEVKYEVDQKNQKLVIKASLPAYAYGNKYTKRSIGKYDFKVTLWIKEGRYKYQINNLVHESIKSKTGNTMRNYFEYYYTTQTNIRQVDQTLRFADKDITAMIENMKKLLADPLFVDEDEW